MILLLSVVLAVASYRYAGESGVRRFEKLTDRRARVLHDQFRSGTKELIIGAGAIACTDAAISAWLGSVRGTVTSLCAAGLLALSAWWGRSARPNILSGFAARGIEPLHQLERSRRRSRRMKQFLVVALLGFLSTFPVRLAGEDHEPQWLGVLAMAGLVTAMVGCVGAAWAGVWRYGDEEPDRR